MGLINSNSVVSNSIPCAFPYGLIHIFDMVVSSDDMVRIFIDDPVSPEYLDIYADNVKQMIYWIGYGEGHALFDKQISHICDHLYAYARMHICSSGEGE